MHEYSFTIQAEDEWSDLECKLFSAGMAAALKKMLEKQGYSAGVIMEYIQPVEYEIEVELDNRTLN